MKYFKILTVLLVGAFMFASCEHDIDPKVPSDAVKPVLEAPAGGGTYVLEKVNEEEIFNTFEWSDADFKLPVVVEYALEVDAKGGDFSNRKIITQSIESPLAIKVSDFNKGLLAAGFEDGQAHDVIVRVVANNHLATDPIEMNVTPYFDAEPWSVIGSAVGGWDVKNDQFMAYDKNKDVYTITLDMTPGDFKFRASKKDDDPWKYNLGLTGDSRVIDNEENVELTDDNGANMKCSGGNYTITLDVKGKKFTIVQNSAGEYTNWAQAKVEAVGTAVSGDNADASDDLIWSFGKVLLADAEGKPSVDGTKYTWTWTGIVLEADQGFKVRNFNHESTPASGLQFDAGFSAVDVANSSDKVKDGGDGNIAVSEKGEYVVTLEIDAASGDVKKLVIKEYVKFPSQIYFVGTVNGWDNANPHYVGPQDAENGVHYGFITAADDTEIKILNNPGSWDGYGRGDEAGKLAAGGDNVIIKDQPGYDGAGQYIVKMNLSELTIELVKITHVAVVGDAANEGWPNDDDGTNQGVELTYDAANKKFAGTVTFKAGGAWKFRFNKTWDYNLGNNDKDLTKLNFGGDNFDSPGAGEKTVSLFLESKDQYSATVE
ncbi:SusF/SusE family outer membrane protein [Marinilabiliaceae bacterium JC017]|nr:SusF/SusE family outer membrane protein [Marinilabiliaceae bacterium JC017]